MNNLCPIDLETVELYLQILKPAYDLSITLQHDKCSITDTITAINILIVHWGTIEVPEYAKPFCQYLIDFVKIKFSQEFNNVIYKVI
jgi:hypothetical protein